MFFLVKEFKTKIYHQIWEKEEEKSLRTADQTIFYDYQFYWACS